MKSSNYNKIQKLTLFTTVCMVITFLHSCTLEKDTQYIDPTIGNVSRFLVPTYPTMHLPNQMMRMFPVKDDYISDQLNAFPLQVVSHRSNGLFQMKIFTGKVSEDSWERKMNIDHDLEEVHPWFYTTYLIEDEIRVSFSPGKKCAIYKIDFTGKDQRNLLFQGSEDLFGESEKDGIFVLEDKVKYETRGLNSVTREMTVFINAMITDDKGQWVEIDPKSDGGPGYREYFDENNGWTYAWDVKHDISGLISLLGGKEKAEARLDQLFREPLGMKRNLFYVNGSNSTGMVGQFSMGNEPSFHIPYLYNFFGAPWKTQKRTRFLLDVWFKDNIFGIPGDEDGGGMSAFVVFSSMGIYPVTPGLPYYTITSPVFEKISIKLTNGNVFTVIAKGSSRKKKYIQRAFINNEEVFGPFITHDQIMKGGTLELELGELPDKNWGSKAELPEFTFAIQ